MYIKSFLLTSQSSNPISAQQNLCPLWTIRRKGPNVCELSCTYGGQSVQVEALIKGIGGCVTNLSALLRSNQIWQHLSSISETKGEARQAHNGTNVLATGAACHSELTTGHTCSRVYLQRSVFIARSIITAVLDLLSKKRKKLFWIHMA